MHGLLILDKPRGPTCQQILGRFRKAFPKTKVGYTGTLDPFATGVLPIFIGAATKLIPFIHEDRKTYEATLKLGEGTDTLDCEGKVIQSSSIPVLKKEEIEQVLAQFLGKRSQIPPKFSAIKVNGTPLYRLARQGIPVEIKPRPIEIFSLKLLNWDSPFIKFETEVSRGTYIRSLALEIAERLGTVGHLTELRRLKSGMFDLGKSVSLESFEENDKIDQLSNFIRENIASLINNFKLIHLKDPRVIQQHLQGQTVLFEDRVNSSQEPLFEHGEKVMIFTPTEILSISEFVVSEKERPHLKPLRIIQLPYA